MSVYAQKGQRSVLLAVAHAGARPTLSQRQHAEMVAVIVGTLGESRQPGHALLDRVGLLIYLPVQGAELLLVPLCQWLAHECTDVLTTQP